MRSCYLKKSSRQRYGRSASNQNVGRSIEWLETLVQRRILMPKTATHLYYRLEGPDLILVLRVWGARRKRGPRL
jgi:plasmid stabilization system protein ParE